MTIITTNPTTPVRKRPQTKTYKAVILGGGITGLSAAFYLQKYATEQGLPLEITLVEKSDRLGGKVHSVRREGFLIEKGPDSFLARKQPILDLTRDLGMEQQLVPTNPKAGSTYIMNNGKLHQMPLGLVLGIPTRITPLIRTGLISPLGKARALLDLLIPAGKVDTDEALGDFIQRRLGREVLEQMTEPLLAGIYAGDTRQLSLGATFPQFKQMERQHRSLIVGMASSMLRRPTTTKTTSTPPKKSMFLSCEGGLSSIIDELEQQLSDVNVLKGTHAVQVKKHPGEAAFPYIVKLNDGKALIADAVICTIPAYAAAELFHDIPHVSELKHIRYVSVANIAFGYRHDQLRQDFEGTGFLVPRKEGRTITACTWSSTKWNHAAPEGQTLLRTYIGRAGAEEWVTMSDDELVAAVRNDLRELIGFDAEPDLVEISRCYHSMPQYPVGHQQMMERIHTAMQRWLPGISLCGAGYGGIGIPDCIQHGRESAEQLIQSWNQQAVSL
ncbi:protoporphyrinogen oxidase [Paenibacillus sp. WLX2291]|uniref:protoporphyrinogen oxidase n=1 Tax=Paenibacillus sp. WLX2291 TaxID=3296934 RepID=UPI003983F1E1